MKKLLSFSGIILFVCMLQSCLFINSIGGNGNVIAKEITIFDYDAIQFSGGASLVYEQKTDVEPYFRVEIDENLFPHLNITSTNGTLIIKNQDNVNIRPTKYTIYSNSTGLKKLKASGSIKMQIKDKLVIDELNMDISGSGEIMADHIECDILKSNASGSSTIILSGKANQLNFSISGSGKVKAASMEAENVYCSLSGSGNFEVFAKTYLKVSISGSGNVQYKGEPNIEKSISGSGKITRID